MLKTLRIAAVSYANTLPFVYGIENSGLLDNYRLLLVPPAQCALAFAKGEVDVALVPVGSLRSLAEYKIISGFCLAANQEVKSVLLLSNKNISEIKTIGLDNESETSVLLVKILTKHYWKINPNYEKVKASNFIDYSGCDAFVVIGDKAFELSHHFHFHTDLATEWFRFAGLPFVFAVWVCKTDLSEIRVQQFTSALQSGIEHITETCIKYQSKISSEFDLESYLRYNIDFKLDAVKNISLQKFLNFVADLDKDNE